MHSYTPIALGVALALGVGFVTTVDASPPSAQATSPAIPAMPLKQALSRFAQREHLQLDVSQLAEGVRTHGAPADLSQHATLQALLRGTGLQFRYLNGDTVTISRAADPSTSDPPQQAASTSPQQKSKNAKKPETLKPVVVTGSLIPQAQIETANPVITITAQNIEQRGFNNIYQALRALPLATGSVDDNSLTGGFTPGATTIRLLGLPPGFTLFLINGRPIADYPLLYGGDTNFTNLSNIPISMVDRVEVLPGNQSSIYGSAAIAGVVNIILKKKMSGYDLDYRAGGYTGGGGQNQRLSFAGGYNKNKLSVMYSVQLYRQNPIFASQRSLTASTLSSPDPFDRTASVVRLHDTDEPRLSYVDPDLSGGCGALSGLFGGTVIRAAHPDRGPDGVGPGYYCGSYTIEGYKTLLDQNKDASGYVNATYQLDDHTQLYGSFLYDWDKAVSDDGTQVWEPNNGGRIFNANTGRLDFYELAYSPEEMGGRFVNARLDEGRDYNATLGIQGSFGSSNWDYNGYLMRSDYKLFTTERRAVTTEVDSFFQNMFLGSQMGTQFGFPVYKPNDAGFYKPITPADFMGFTAESPVNSHSYIQNANFQLTNQDLFHLPAGPVGFAALLQAGDQLWESLLDPRVVQGYFWGLTGASGQGTRHNYAGAMEFRVPIFSMLTADVSARYDHYNNVGGSSDQRPTYKLGLSFRPLSTLLLRANYATAFRAPDMAETFIGPSGAFESTTDFYKCEKYEPNTPLVNCDWFSSPYQRLESGNADLKSITAKSFGYGVVWSPNQNFTAKADYYHISIGNEVALENVTQLMQQEAECRLGQLGIDSSTCVNVLDSIVRGPVNSNPEASEPLQSIHVVPINVSNEMVRGIVASLDYRLDAGRFGRFGFGLQYNVTLDHTFQEFPDSPREDLLHDPQFSSFGSSQFKTIATAHVNWDIGKWSTTLEEQRYGATPNYAAQVFGWDAPASSGGAGTLPPWIVFNGSVEYHVTPDIRASLIVNNIGDKLPHPDSTWFGWPFFNNYDYNIYGRAVWAELDIHFPGPSHG